MFADHAEVKGHGVRRLSVRRSTLLLGIGVLHLLLCALCRGPGVLRARLETWPTRINPGRPRSAINGTIREQQAVD